MLEERTLLATHEARTKKSRTTKAALQALAGSDIPPDIPDDVAALVTELMGERQAMRDARKVRDCQRPLKGLLMHLNSEPIRVCSPMTGAVAHERRRHPWSYKTRGGKHSPASR